MMVLIRRPLAARVSNVLMSTCATGVGDVLGNKGGVGLSFTYQETSLAFVACHLAARSERVSQRAENVSRILRQLALGAPGVELLAQLDHFWILGDLNYRTEGLEFSEVLALVKAREFALLAQYDQLRAQRDSQLVFPGFKEGSLKFAPTYRWERRENVFSNKKFQLPSWTDRVLWHSAHRELADLELKSYTSAPNVFCSDHRPVMATFVLQPRAPYTAHVPDIHAAPLIPVHLPPGSYVPPAAAVAKAAPAASPSSVSPPAAGATNATSTPKSPAGASTFVTQSGPHPARASGGAGTVAALRAQLELANSLHAGGSPPPVSRGSTAGRGSTASGEPYRHFTLPAGFSLPAGASPLSPQAAAARHSVAIGPLPPPPGAASPATPGGTAAATGADGAKAGAAPSSSSSATLSSSKGTAIFPFTHTPLGPLYTPPILASSSSATMGVAGRVRSTTTPGVPQIGQSKDFAIVLQNVRVTLATPPKGDMVLTASAPFLAHWKPSPPAAYTLPESNGSGVVAVKDTASASAASAASSLFSSAHWEELLLPPFVHDLFYLYQRHLVLVLSVPSDSSGGGGNGSNTEQTGAGAGAQLGTAALGLSNVCANIFQQIALIDSASPPSSSAGGAGSGSGKPNPWAQLRHDQGGQAFVAPLLRDGVYVGRIEGKMLFRYGTPTTTAEKH